MSSHPKCISSISTVHYRTGKRGPAPKSCWACRSRKTVCKRPSGAVGEGAAACEGCQKRGLVCSMLPPDSGPTFTKFTLFQLAEVLIRSFAAIDARPAKRKDTAKTSYGSLPSFSTSSLAPAGQRALVPSGLETRLADNEMCETLGLELLQIYGDAGNACSDPLYPPPVLDYLELQDRFKAVGKRLAHLPKDDQLTCRIIFASASRFRRSKGSSIATHDKLVQELAADAQVRADAAGIWRRPSTENGTNLLLLHLLASQGEISSQSAKPYLVSLCAHIKSLLKTNPQSIFGSADGAPALGWSVLSFDTWSAIERREAPCCSPTNFKRLLGPVASPISIESALRSYPWSTTSIDLGPLALFHIYGRRLAYLFESCPYGLNSVEAAIELNEIWAVLDGICAWAEKASTLHASDLFTLTVLRLYLSLVAGPAIFAQLAIIQYLEEFETFPPPAPLAHPLPTRSQLARNACSYLRSARNEGDKSFMAVFTGTGCLRKTVLSVLRVYPSEPLSNALLSLELEQKALEALPHSLQHFDVPILAATASPSSTTPKDSAPASSAAADDELVELKTPGIEIINGRAEPAFVGGSSCFSMDEQRSPGLPMSFTVQPLASATAAISASTTSTGTTSDSTSPSSANPPIEDPSEVPLIVPQTDERDIQSALDPRSLALPTPPTSYYFPPHVPLPLFTFSPINSAPPFTNPAATSIAPLSRPESAAVGPHSGLYSFDGRGENEGRRQDLMNPWDGYYRTEISGIGASPSSALPAKRNETAKATYGSLPSSSSTSSSLALVPSGLETRMADNEMSETLGLELLQIYGDAGSTCSDPLYPPPVLDYLALQGRYETAGKRLTNLSIEDQLTCRIVFATASRMWRSGKNAATNGKLVQQLLTNAQTRADATGVWRNPTPANAISLLLLYQLANQGEIASIAAKPYLVSLAAQLKVLHKSASHAPVVTGVKGTSATALSWCLLAFDTFASIERKEAPVVSKADHNRLLGGLTVALPPLAAMEFALQADPWSTTNYCLLPLAFLISFGRRLACLMEVYPHGVNTVEGMAELNEIWAALNEICDWTAAVSRLEASDPFSITILQLYLNLTAGGAIFAQLAIIEHQEQLKISPISSPLPPQVPSPTLAEFAMNVCSYLRSIRTDGQKSFMAVFTGTAWSVSRLAAFANVFNGTSAWDKTLHPAGPADKVVSLRFLCSTLSSVLRAYDFDPLQKALMALEAEKGALEVLLGPTNVDSVPLATANQPSSDQPVSLGRLATWTHTLDKEEKQAVAFQEPIALDGDVQPFFRRAASFSAFASEHAATPPFSYAVEALKQRGIAPRTDKSGPPLFSAATPFLSPSSGSTLSSDGFSPPTAALVFNDPNNLSSPYDPALSTTLPPTLPSSAFPSHPPPPPPVQATEYSDLFLTTFLSTLVHDSAPMTSTGVQSLELGGPESGLFSLDGSGGSFRNEGKQDFLAFEGAGGVGEAAVQDTVPFLWQ
ncbi:hypothetical protein JCM8547_008080 [Rhodosporidiobolus lusitaniae]